MEVGNVGLSVCNYSITLRVSFKPEDQASSQSPSFVEVELARTYTSIFPKLEECKAPPQSLDPRELYPWCKVKVKELARRKGWKLSGDPATVSGPHVPFQAKFVPRVLG